MPGHAVRSTKAKNVCKNAYNDGKVLRLTPLVFQNQVLAVVLLDKLFVAHTATFAERKATLLAC